ncbi:MAG: sulfite exporter TauE/SafE family protein [Bacteriovoracaceae bacterium]|nr:sulfite exporter TauE/SafE family protein [Bacteriovoracaceae bacterium]
MSLIIICFTACIASILTFFSGFGLGTLLLPVFAIWFPTPLAVALTAIVHFLNNIFKFVLIGRYLNKEVLLKFGLPALIFSFLGAKLLIKISSLSPLYRYTLFEKNFEILPIKLILAFIIFIFVLIEGTSYLKNISIPLSFLPLGGMVSGFFGGLSGHQGALRTIFLSKMNLSKESFVATGTTISILVDMARLTIYFKTWKQTSLSSQGYLIFWVVLSAFLGAYLGNTLLQKITFNLVHRIISISLMLLALSLGLGFI